MLSNVQIIKIASNNLIAEYSIELVDDSVEEDYFDEAWDNAVDDGLVEESSRLEYSIQFADKAEKL